MASEGRILRTGFQTPTTVHQIKLDHMNSIIIIIITPLFLSQPCSDHLGPNSSSRFDAYLSSSPRAKPPTYPPKYSKHSKMYQDPFMSYFRICDF
jgi:hypothetical protein